MKRFLVVVFMISTTFLNAQVKQGWYVGTRAGMSVVDNTFSSFGAESFRPGYAADITLGYSFGSVFSMDISAGLGRSFAEEQSCCLARGYWYGEDGRRHLALNEGMTGYKYSDMYSSVAYQNYQLGLNFNVLGFFPQLRTSPWTLELSPLVSAVRTGTDLLLKEGKAAVREDIKSWHFGYGGKVEVSYAFAERFRLGLFCDLRQLTGSPSDGLERLHYSNLLSRAGLSFLFKFGLKEKKRRTAPSGPQQNGAPMGVVNNGVETAAATEAVSMAETAGAVEKQAGTVEKQAGTVEKPADAVEKHAGMVENQAGVVENQVDAVEKQAEERAVEEKADEVQDAGNQGDDAVEKDRFVEDTRFPRVHFSFNSVWVEWDEREVVRKIASMLKEEPSLHIKLMGWGDKVGGDEVNLRVSKQRSEAIKAALVKQQIAADRIETAGGGIKYDAPSDAEARCVQVLVEL